MAEPQQDIPPFREDGYLPEGVHRASEAEATFRFGTANRRRRRLVLQMRRWLELAHAVSAERMLIDGSFVTSKEKPNDIDAVVLLPANFEEQVGQGSMAALELEGILLTRMPAELFAAEDADDWLAWVAFFGRTREADGRRKGLVEIAL